jgi:putative DNA primase/helicase
MSTTFAEKSKAMPKDFEDILSDLGINTDAADLTFRDEPDYLQQHFVMIHGTDCVFDNVAGRLMKAGHLRLSAPVAYKLWQSSPGRKIVDVEHVVFDPTGKAGEEKINLFAGIKMKPKSGDCDLILDLLMNLCNNDQAMARWVLSWVAYPLQHVGAKMQTSIIMRGWKNGTGKNLFWEDVVAKIYGNYGMTIDQSDIDGGYNGWASGKLFIVADEVVSPGEKWQIKGALKRLVTGETIRINEKYLPTRTESNHVNIVFLSNENVPLPIDSDDRRYCVVEPNIKKPPDYYRRIADAIRNQSAVEAFYQFLLNIDLKDFDPHAKPPENDDKRNLIHMSMRSHERFIHDWVAGETQFPYEPVLSDALFLAYQVWCKLDGEKATNANTFGREIQKFVVTERKNHPGGQKKRVYVPQGWEAAIKWGALDDFYDHVRAMAASESRIKL